MRLGVSRTGGQTLKHHDRAVDIGDDTRKKIAFAVEQAKGAETAPDSVFDERGRLIFAKPEKIVDILVKSNVIGINIKVVFLNNFKRFFFLKSSLFYLSGFNESILIQIIKQFLPITR